MNLAELSVIRNEIEAALRGRPFGAVFQLSRFELAIDFRADGGRYLFISIEPADPRAYLIKRRLRELEKVSGTPSVFTMALRKNLSGALLEKIELMAGERIPLMHFAGANEIGEAAEHQLAVQLTGRSANIFLLDSEGQVVAAARPSSGPGQEIGDTYSPPLRATAAEPGQDEVPVTENLSEYLDRRDAELRETKRFDALAASARSKVQSELKRREKLLGKLRSDLENHGDADKWKKYGDLLLAATATARREGGNFIVTDYYDDAVPEIAIEADENESISEAAEKYFKKYTKARNAAEEINKRLAVIENELAELRKKKLVVEEAIAARDEESLERLAAGPKTRTPAPGKSQKSHAASGSARSFISSDGFEILVGKKSRDNDVLTFKISKSLDTWMHAADYPGSHVVIRNHAKSEIPHQTLLEAAQLAAFYSQARKQPKAAVHYTLRKFVNKPKGAAPGLVSLSSHKTLMVIPAVPDSVEMRNTGGQK